MTENQEERERRRVKIIHDASDAADRIIMDGSNGSQEETSYLTAGVAGEFIKRALYPFGMKMLEKDIEDDAKKEE